MHVHVHVHTYVFTCPCACMQVSAGAYASTHVCLHMHRHTQMCARICTCTLSKAEPACTSACAHLCAYTYMHPCMCMSAHLQAGAHPCACMSTWAKADLITNHQHHTLPTPNPTPACSKLHFGRGLGVGRVFQTTIGDIRSEMWDIDGITTFTHHYHTSHPNITSHPHRHASMPCQAYRPPPPHMCVRTCTRASTCTCTCTHVYTL